MSGCYWRLEIVLGILIVASGTACFRSSDMTKLSCTDSVYCPEGYICVGVTLNSPGLCARRGSYDSAIDGFTSGGGVPEDAASGVTEAAMPLDTSLDKVVLDVSQDQPSIPEVNVVFDSTLDSPLSVPDAGFGFDLGLDVSPLKAQGEACSVAAECQGGLTCADGVCCDKTCGGCFACSAELNGSKNGSCLPVPTGQRSQNACPMSGTTCGLDGTCDGNGSCRYGAKETVCGSICSGSTLTTSVCNGAGTCASGTPQACSGSLTCADSRSCKSTCSTSTDCVTGNCTSAGTCGTQKLGNGATCSAGTECSSGNCVASRCCASSSCPACQDCSGVGGTCATIAGSDGQSCGTNMYCQGGTCGACTPGLACSTGNVCEDGATSCATGRSACTKTGNKSGSTQCSAQTCSGSTQYNVAHCNAGTCPTATTSTCSYGCNGNACQNLKPNGTVCSASSECQTGGCIWDTSAGNYVCGNCGTLNAACCMTEECRSGFYCVNQTSCQAQKNLGDSCSSSRECLSGFCSMAGICVIACGQNKGDGCCAGGDCAGALYCVNPNGVGWFCLPCGVSGSWCCTAPAQACNAGLTCNTDTNACG